MPLPYKKFLFSALYYSSLHRDEWLDLTW
jgi:hypothetical protein